MSKLKRYMVTKTVLKMYEVYDNSPEEALAMVENKTSGGLAGLPNQKGYNTLWQSPPPESYTVTEEI